MRKRPDSRHSIKFSIIASTISLIAVLSIIIFVITYSSFNKNIKDTVEVQTREISHQIVYNYENYFSTIIDTSNLIQVDLSNYNIIENQNEVSNYLRDIIRLKQELIQIDIYSTDGKIIASTNTDSYSVIALNESWFGWAVKEPTIHYFSTPYEVDGQYRITISKYISYNQNNNFAVLRLEINFDSIINLANNANLGDGGFISIIDSEYNSIYSSKSSLTLDEHEEKALLQSIILGSKQTKVGEYEMMIHVDTLENTRWRICVFSNIDHLMAIKNDFLRNITVVSIIFIFIASFILLGVSKRITSPLKQLESVMRKVEQNENFVVEKVTIKANNTEVANLTSGFNHMMKRIKELMDKIVFEQKQQRKSELKALQNQINPHFLYNTLDSITWLIEKNRNEQAAEMVIALAKFFRISISKGRNIITIRDELEHARNYLLIQSYRYQDAFEYEFIVDKEVLDYPCIKLILQPIIENAIYHGVRNRIDAGRIVIRAEQNTDTIILSVSDNGFGILPEKIDSLYSNFKSREKVEGVGLKNIYQRLSIYYGDAARLVIDSELDEGTTISVIIPK